MHLFHRDKWKKLVSDISRLFEIEKVRERNTRQERKKRQISIVLRERRIKRWKNITL